MTLIMDGEELGVPMESVYGDEVDRLRRQGLRLGEVVMPCRLSTAREGVFPDISLHQPADGAIRPLPWPRRPDCGRASEARPLLSPLHGLSIFRIKEDLPDGPQSSGGCPMAGVCADRPGDSARSTSSSLAKRSRTHELRPQPIDEEDREYFRPMIDPNFQCAPLGDTNDDDQDREDEELIYAR